MIPFLPEARNLQELEKALVFRQVLINTNEAPVDQLCVLIQTNPRVRFDIQFGKSPSVDQVTELLNCGANTVIVDIELAATLINSGLPANRLSISTTVAEAPSIIEQGKYDSVCVDFSPDVNKLWELAESQVQKTGSLTKVYVFNADKTYKEVNPAIPVLPVSELTNDPEGEPTKVSTADVIISRLTSDRPDGYYLTVVTDHSGKLLGTVFSSDESIKEAVRTRTGVYQSRKRGLWYKGASSGATQKLLGISIDCDGDALQFLVEQAEPGFCHNNIQSCFGQAEGIDLLTQTLKARKATSVEGSYTQRLFNDSKLLRAKIMEEAEELCDAETPSEIAWEAADLLYFMAVKLAANNLTIADVEANLDAKSRKVVRRKGDAKPKWENQTKAPAPAPAAPKPVEVPSGPIRMNVVSSTDKGGVEKALQRPAQSSNAFELARPIVEQVKQRGDAALLELTAKFEKCQLSSPVLEAPFSEELMKLEPEIKDAIDLACANVEKFHAAQLTKDTSIETAPGVVCSRFARAIQRVGLYVPGGTAVLPSTAIMLGVPAKVAGCKDIVFASPPGSNGRITPEVVYVAHKVGAKQIVLAGGAQAIASMAYGTEKVLKTDKILGPGNQFVTAAKMMVSNDLNAQVSIDMPAGPSEVLVVADRKADKSFVVSDLLSQAEHGPDSQVILIAIDWQSDDISALQAELDKQATALPRVDVIRKSIAHSTILTVATREEAISLSNQYAPEHLILQVEDARELVPSVINAGSVFIGALSPESCGDYTSGTNHTLPTYGYAHQYSGVNTSTFLKHITAQELTPKGIANIGPATVALARREGLDGHANAVVVRLDALKAANQL